MVEQFTPRENEIAKHLCLGKSEKMIAGDLFIEWDTVHTHTRNMRKKIGGNNAIDIVRTFILSLDDPKKFFAAIAFIGIQFMVISKDITLQVRKTPKVVRTETFSRWKPNRTRKTYYC